MKNNLFKLLLVTILSLALAFTMVACNQPGEELPQAWDGTTVASDAEMEDLYDDATSTYSISLPSQLAWVAKQVNDNSNAFSEKTIKLVEDINLDGKTWTPIGQTGATQFLGTFDGQNHTIYNLKIDSSAQTGANYSSGLFGWIERHGEDANYLMAVKNLNVNGADVNGNHNVAVIVGWLSGTVENCHVTNAKVVCNHANDDACGDKAGVIVGFANKDNTLIKNCSAKTSTVTAGRDAGQVVGAAYENCIVNCTATGVIVTATGDCTGANIRNEVIGRVLVP